MRPACVFALVLAFAPAATAAAQLAAVPAPLPLPLPTPDAALAPEVRSALGIDALLNRLTSLRAGGQGDSLAALNTRQQVLEHVLAASFAVDSVLGRIDTEASYAAEDRYVLEVRSQHQANTLNLVTFGASGALGAAGSAMQLTHGLNHAGTALQAAAGGTSLVLTGIQLKTAGGRQPVRTPYNMLAEILDQPPNTVSRYPPVVLAYLHARGPQETATLAERITSAWGRLHRLRQGAKGDGASIKDLTADRASGAKLSADELADREAMLRDLHASIILLRSDLQQVLAELEASHGDGTPEDASGDETADPHRSSSSLPPVKEY